MSHQVLTNAKLWLAGYNFSGDANALALDYGAEAKDDTTFGAGTRANLGGLKTIAASAEGFITFGADTIDEYLFSKVSVGDELFSASPAGVEGEPGFSFLAVHAQYNPGEAVGEIIKFGLKANANGAPFVRGTVMLNGTKTATGNGTARQLGAVGATQRLYAGLHVFTVSGTTPTLDATVKSDDGVGFASPTTRITFAQKTARGFEWATSVAGPITDDWWRIDYTIGGGSPSFLFAVIVGIQ